VASESLDIVFCLIAGHLLGDFVLQSDGMARGKRDPAILFIHISLVTAVTYLLCGAWTSWRIVAGVFATHLVIDGIKAASGRDGPRVFLLDQGAHLAALTAIGVYGLSPAIMPYWQVHLPFYSKAMLLLAGAILCVRVGGFWIAKAVAPFQEAIGQSTESLPNAGRIIGQLERGLIFLLVLAGELQGVGFLIAAKSILRFGEVRESSQRKEAEYIIIGTLMSFGWALLVSFATRYLLSLL